MVILLSLATDIQLWSWGGSPPEDAHQIACSCAPKEKAHPIQTIASKWSFQATAESSCAKISIIVQETTEIKFSLLHIPIFLNCLLHICFWTPQRNIILDIPKTGLGISFPHTVPLQCLPFEWSSDQATTHCLAQGSNLGLVSLINFKLNSKASCVYLLHSLFLFILFIFMATYSILGHHHALSELLPQFPKLPPTSTYSLPLSSLALNFSRVILKCKADHVRTFLKIFSVTSDCLQDADQILWIL